MSTHLCALYFQFMCSTISLVVDKCYLKTNTNVAHKTNVVSWENAHTAFLDVCLLKVRQLHSYSPEVYTIRDSQTSCNVDF